VKKALAGVTLTPKRTALRCLYSLFESEGKFTLILKSNRCEWRGHLFTVFFMGVAGLCRFTINFSVPKTQKCGPQTLCIADKCRYEAEA
jgi:hypothetical protein